MTAPGRTLQFPWVMITDYPRWPSPYFSLLHRHAPAELGLAFRPGLDALEAFCVPGVINLHRLKRLYTDRATGTRTPAAAAAFLGALTRLREQGWRVAWTMHNLLPIDGQPPGSADQAVTQAVLGLAFLAATRDAHLAVAGSCRDSRTAAELAALAAGSDGRVSVSPERFAPEQAGHLYAAAHVAVCPYRADGPFRFLAGVLYPGSVGTATGFHVPVVAPALPAIAEITGGQQRWLAPPAAGLGQAMATAEADMHHAARTRGDPRGHRPAADAARSWRRITDVYHQAASDLRQKCSLPTPQGDSAIA